ncbi:MAG: hypothetical protein JXR73_05820 [Candidatus Omnitrophica bacterium]|nr:hypothetical protein [Candidatus Omnitrophota bacterium]
MMNRSYLNFWIAIAAALFLLVGAPCAMGQGVIVTASEESSDDLSGQTYEDENGDGLVIQWDLVGYDAKDIHVYVLANDEGKIKYLGRTADGDAAFFHWYDGNPLAAGQYRNGPQSGNSYRFYIYLLPSTPGKRVFGPLAAAAPVYYLIPPNLISHIIVTDTVDSEADLNGGADIDPSGDRELVVKWKNFDMNDVKDVHVYVLANEEGKIKYLGRTGNGDDEFFSWKQGARFLSGQFKGGPQHGETYRFGIYFLHKHGRPSGPFMHTDPVQFFVSDNCVFPEDFEAEDGSLVANGVAIEGSSLDVILGDPSYVYIPDEAMIYFDEACPNGGPVSVSILYSSEGDVDFEAQPIENQLPENADASITIEIQDNTSHVQLATFENPEGIPAIHVSGDSEIAIMQICWECSDLEPAPTVTPTPTVTPVPTTPPSWKNCVVPGDTFFAEENIIEDSLDFYYLSLFRSNPVEDSIFFKIRDCIHGPGLSNAGDMDVLIPFDGESDENPAVIAFNEEALEDGFPKTVSLFMTSEDEVELEAYNSAGEELLSAEVEFEYKDDDFNGEEYQIQNGNPDNGYQITIRVRNNASNVKPVVLSSEEGIASIDILGESDVCLQKICWDCKHIEPMPTPTPGETTEPGGLVWVTTEPSESPDGDLSGQTINSTQYDALVINWEFQNYPAKDFHIYAQVDGSKKRMYIGRTGDGDADFFVWKSYSGFLSSLFKIGPQPGHSYLFMVYAISSERGVKPFGPIAASGWITYQEAIVEQPIAEEAVIITDDLDSMDDLSNGEDSDPENDMQLVLRWNLKNVNAKDFHIYVQSQNDKRPKYLGRTGDGDASLFQWKANGRFLHQNYKAGPVADNEYAFSVYAINKKGPKAFEGPFYPAGPVLYKVIVEEEPEVSIPTFIEPTPIPPTPTPTPVELEETPTPEILDVTVSDSETTYDDLSNGQDVDMPGNLGLVIRWSSELADDAKEIEIYVEINGSGQIKKLANSKNPQSLFLNWAAGNDKIMEAFRNGPEAGYSYTFYVYVNTKGSNVNGPFTHAGPVELVLSKIAPVDTPTPKVPPGQLKKTPTPAPSVDDDDDWDWRDWDDDDGDDENDDDDNGRGNDWNNGKGRK